MSIPFGKWSLGVMTGGGKIILKFFIGKQVFII
jgi:hypothetical protein